MSSRTLWSVARLGTSLLVAATAVHYILLAFRGLLDVPAGTAEPPVHGALLQSVVNDREGTNAGILAFPLMIAVELLSGLLLLTGAARGVRSWRDHPSWRRGQRPALLGCQLGMVVMSIGLLPYGIDSLLGYGLLILLITAVTVVAPHECGSSRSRMVNK